MKKMVIAFILISCMLINSGCIVAIASAIAWDQKRARQMEKEKENQEKKENVVECEE